MSNKSSSREDREHRIIEFAAYSVMGLIMLSLATVGVSVSYFVLTWAFGLR